MPICADAKVGLDFQGLTGIASISIKGVSSDAPPLTVENGELPTLIADPAATQDVTATIREVAVNASALVRRLEEKFPKIENRRGRLSPISKASLMRLVVTPSCSTASWLAWKV